MPYWQSRFNWFIKLMMPDLADIFIRGSSTLMVIKLSIFFHHSLMMMGKKNKKLSYHWWNQETERKTVVPASDDVTCNHHMFRISMLHLTRTSRNPPSMIMPPSVSALQYSFIAYKSDKACSNWINAGTASSARTKLRQQLGHSWGTRKATTHVVW